MHPFTSSRKIIFTGTLLAISALYQASAFAEDSTAQKQVPPPPANVVKPVDPSALNPEQREAFRAISKNMYETMRSGKELHEEILSLTQADAYDEKKVRELIQKHHKEAEESLVKASRDMHDFYKTLSPEQKKQFDAMSEKMKERRKEEMKDRMKEHIKERAEKQPAKEGDGK